MEPEEIIIRPATDQDQSHAPEISAETERSAIERGIGISRRSAECIAEKMNAGKAVIATKVDSSWVGFIYFETWANNELISQSGLIVSPLYRKRGIASQLKKMLFDICRKKYPNSKLFSITSATAIMKMNTALGFHPVGYEQLGVENSFWSGCSSCVNYDILTGKCFHNCLCTAMLYESTQPKYVNLLFF